MTYLIEYLGKFEFIFEAVLDYVSGGLMGSFEAKNTESKISCLGTFKCGPWSASPRFWLGECRAPIKGLPPIVATSAVRVALGMAITIFFVIQQVAG